VRVFVGCLERVFVMNDELFPELPYAGSSGWSGTDTSRERAERQDRSGGTARMDREALWSLGVAAYAGLTWKELAEEHGWHHGQASGRLTTLHKAGRVVRLLEKRDRCRVYVDPRFQAGRDSDEPVVRMTQTEMYKTLCYLHQRAVLMRDEDGVRLLEQRLDAYFPQWKKDFGGF